MGNFCPKCGKENEPADNFCRNCGASLAGSGPAPQEAAKPAVVSVAANPVSVRQKPLAVQIIAGILQLVIFGLFAFWVWYSYGCAVGKYRGNGDQVCQWFDQTFSVKKEGGTDNNGGGGGGTSCIPTGCGSLIKCNGTYYSEDGQQMKVNSCFTSGNRPDRLYSSTWSGECRQCP